MTIGVLTVSHLEGYAILASKHTTQSAKVNEIIGVTNLHTDLCFTNDGLEWKPNIWSDTTNYEVLPLTWSGDSTAQIETSNLNGKFLVSILIKEDRSTYQGDLTRIQLFNGPLISDPVIMDIVISGNYQYRDDTANDVRYWIFTIGLYRLPDDTMLLRLYNGHASETLDILEIHFTGYTT